MGKRKIKAQQPGHSQREEYQKPLKRPDKPRVAPKKSPGCLRAYSIAERRPVTDRGQGMDILSSIRQEKYDAQGLKNNDQVARQRNLVNVAEIQSQLVGQNTGAIREISIFCRRQNLLFVPVFDRSRIGKPWTHRENPKLFVCVNLDVATELRPRTDYTHLPEKNVPKLR